MDPKDNFPYVYYVTRDRRRAELMAYMEDSSNVQTMEELLVPSTYA
jgi:hypothetical protein